MRPIRELRPDGATWSVLAIALAALAMRLVDLDARPMHHDESLHAAFSWYFSEGRGYFHDPLMHGPLQFHLIGGAFRLLGESELVSRLPAALFGSALVACPLLLRGRLGATGVVVAAVMIALSPSLLYYSRFARNDLLFALFTVLLVAAVWRYREQADEEVDGERAPGGAGGVRGGRWLLLAAAALALSFTTKETAYLTAAMLLLYLDAAVAWRLVPERLAGARRLACWAALLPVAWALVALWPLVGALRRRWGLGPWSADCDLLVVVGTLTATQLGAFALLPAGALAGELSADDERALSVAVILLLALGAAEVGLRWSRWWLAPALLFAAIYVPLYTTFGTNPAGLHSGLWGSLDYWLAQQEVQRGHQPGFYYAFMVPLYEPLALAAGLLGGCWLLARGNRLARLLLWWFAWMFLSLSLAGEKMPWLTVHLALPLALLAALVAGEAARRLRAAGARALLRGPLRAGLAAAAVASVLALGMLTVRTGTAVSYLHPGTPVEPLIYTQTSPDLPEVAREIAAYAEANGTGTGLPMLVETRLSLSWPWAWYLRDYHQVLYASAETLREQEPDPGRVLIATAWTLDEVPGLRAAYGESRPYRHRSWFPEIRYKSASFGSVFSGLADGSLLHDWWRFLFARIDESDIGSLRAEVLFPGDAAASAPGGTP